MLRRDFIINLGSHFPRELPPRARRPPDYNVAAQMARMARLSRAHSHEGVTAGYYNSDPDEEDGIVYYILHL